MRLPIVMKTCIRDEIWEKWNSLVEARCGHDVPTVTVHELAQQLKAMAKKKASDSNGIVVELFKVWLSYSREVAKYLYN